MRRNLVVSLVLLGLLSSPARAQTCLGLASYSGSPVQVTGTGSLAYESRSFGAGVGYGLPTGGFGGVAVGTTLNDSFDGSTLELGATLGYQLALGKTGATELCPVASFAVGIGPRNTFNSGVDRSRRTASVGLAVGRSLVANHQLRIVPTLGLSYAYRKDKAENSAGTRLFEIADHYALAQVGVGLVLNSNISVRPSIDVPLGLDGTDPTFGITLGYNFGGSHSRPALRSSQEQ